VVQGNPRLRASVAATATGDLYQCLAQRPTIDALRRMAHGMAVRGTAAPGCTPTEDTRSALRLTNLAEALHRLGIEHALCHLLQPQHVLHLHEVELLFTQTFAVLVEDRYLTDLTEERHAFLDPDPRRRSPAFREARRLAAHLRHRDEAGRQRHRVRGRPRRAARPAR